jgi:hypothetical protein
MQKQAAQVYFMMHSACDEFIWNVTQVLKLSYLFLLQMLNACGTNKHLKLKINVCVVVTLCCAEEQTAPSSS